MSTIPPSTHEYEEPGVYEIVSRATSMTGGPPCLTA